MGVDGGSSDESDPEPGSKNVIVRERPWRSQVIKRIVMVLDGFKPKYTGLGRHTPGNPGRPRERREGGPYCSQDIELKGLPENYYDQLWLNSLSQLRREWLGIAPQKPLPLPTRSPFT